MLTLFSCPKPFRGQIGVIQRNAIRSWLYLQPGVQILLFGNEEGTESLAAELELTQVPDVQRNAFGTPLVNDIFVKAHRLAKHPLLCYVNSDVILTNRFRQAIEVVSGLTPPTLTVGRCWDLNIGEEINYEQYTWEADLERRVMREGRLRGLFHIDYGIFTSGLFRGMPPFALGRIRWDNWLVWKALSEGAAVVDASRFMKPIHQIHGYDHLPGIQCRSVRCPEAKMNQRLAGIGRFLHVYGLLDATHCLTNEGAWQRLRIVFPFVQQIGLRMLLRLWEGCQSMTGRLRERRKPDGDRGCSI